MITGLTSDSKKNFQLDAGAIYKGWVMGTDTPSSATSKLIGATEAGGTLSIVPEIRQITVDGAKGPTKGLEVIDGWTATLSATFKEVKKETIALALGAVTQTSSTTPSGYTKLVPDPEIDDTDYTSNIAWVGSVIGSSSPIVIILQNVLSINGWSLAFKDKGEGTVPVTFTAHTDLSTPDTIPVEIWMPTIS